MTRSESCGVLVGRLGRADIHMERLPGLLKVVFLLLGRILCDALMGVIVVLCVLVKLWLRANWETLIR